MYRIKYIYLIQFYKLNTSKFNLGGTPYERV